jgi:hypothetical protein
MSALAEFSFAAIRIKAELKIFLELAKQKSNE